MPTGTVTWFSPDRGYGFIAPDDGGEDLFTHYSHVEEIDGDGRRNLAKDQRVEFVVARGPKGPQAEQVRVIE